MKKDLEILAKGDEYEGRKALARLGARRSGLTRKMNHAYLKHGKAFDHPDQVELGRQHKEIGDQIGQARAIRAKNKAGGIEKGEELTKSESDELCPFCQQSDAIDPTHCLFCHDAEQDGVESCPFCEESAAGADLLDPNCELCQQMGQAEPGATTKLYAQPAANNPTAEDEDIANREKQAQSMESMEQTPPAIDKQSPELIPAPAEAAPLAPEGSAAIDPEDNSSKDALTAIAQQIESEGTPPASAVNAIEDSALPTGTEVEGNISRPDGFGSNTAGDMGLGGTNGPEENGEDPDLSSLLEEGLDEHADGIQRERVVQMTSQALQQFKASKQLLENAKMQMPQLYTASITMLKAMIEMANLLGLGQGLGQPGAELGQNPTQLGQAQAELTPQEGSNEWNELFPAHPDHGGAELKPGHAPPSKSSEEDGSQAPQP